MCDYMLQHLYLHENSVGWNIVLISSIKMRVKDNYIPKNISPEKYLMISMSV